MKRLPLALASLALAASSFAAPTLTVDLAAPGKPISPDLFGVFFEDLNYAADGGLYAEMIQNRSFEYSASEQPQWGPFSFWELIQRREGKGHLGLGDARPIHEHNPHYLLLTVEEPGAGVGAANSGYDRMQVEGGEDYRASFWAYQAYMGIMWKGTDEQEKRPMPMSLRLEAKDGSVLAEATFDVSGRTWTKREATLTPSRSDDGARLVVLAHAQGCVAVDMVSLFPSDTYKGRANGLRRDLAETIAAIHPRFMRFPGGCLVHGPGVHRFYNWKDTVGPVEQRRGQRNSWGYHQEMGLGYHEFFQFCEDMGAMPLPVVTAGVCCQHAGHSPGRGQEGLPLDEMGAYIQDVLDLIEWANGPADSKWGAIRAAAGHEKPFGLKYLGVGNEDAITPEFKERFQMIFDAIKKAHPEIVVVGTAGPFPDGEDFEKGWEYAKALKVPMVDEHYYKSPDWFWNNLHRYERYDRNGAKVYVGEYAAHDDKRRSTLRSAIAEAAYLTSLERNGDVVHFASYAPLLARRGHTQWTPDLIYFDGNTVYPTLNYEVQKLFGNNSGNESLPAEWSSIPDGSKLSASVVRDAKTGDIILKVVNGEQAPTAVTLRLTGTAAPKSASSIIFGGSSADVANEDGQPAAVTPRIGSLSLGGETPYEAPANSITVVRIPATKR